MAAADQRQHRGHARHRGETVEEVVLGTEHDRGPQDDGIGVDLANGLFGTGLGLGIDGRRLQVGPDGRDLDEALDAGLARRLGDGTGAEDMHGLEGLPAAFAQHTDEIDDDLGVAQRGSERGPVADIGLDRLDLADAPQGLQVIGEIGATATGQDPEAVLSDGADHMPAEETGATQDGHQPIGREIRSGHPVLL